MSEDSTAPSRAAGEPLFLAIDQGGQSSRALVFDRHGQLLASAVAPVPTSHPEPGRVEQDPIALLRSVTESLAAVADRLGERVQQVQAAGLATQRSSIVCWDRVTGEPLSPVLSWQDRRGESQVRRLAGHARRVSEITGLALSSHYGASKIRWCLDHLPAVRKSLDLGRLASGPLASFLLFHLCEERPVVVDPAIAARTQLYSLEIFDWSPELLDLFGVPRTVLPACIPSRHRFGRVRFGGRSIPLEVSTGDQSAALFATGQPPSDTAVVNLGTGAFVQRVSKLHLGCDSGLLESLVWHDGDSTLHALEGSINGCGSALEEMGAKLGFDDVAIKALADEWLGRQEAPPLFLNGVSGLGSPYWVADYRSRLVGSGEPWKVMVAVFESILFLVQINLELMSRELGHPRKIYITGGLAASSGLCQRLANLTGIETQRSEIPEATARGLANLLSGSPEREDPVAAADRFVPRRDQQLEARFRQWRQELEASLPTLSADE